MLATLRQRNFALLWLAGLISNAGDWVLFIGLPIYIFLLTHSVLAVSLMMLVGRIPNVLIGSLAGVFVDRWDRRRIMIVANLLLAAALLPLLLVRDADLVWIAYAANFVSSAIEQFFNPAQSALIPRLVGEEHIVAANSLNSLANNLARLVGPAIGGVVAATLGLAGMVAIDAASFLIGAALVALIAAPRAVTAARPDPTAHPAPVTPAAEASAFVRMWREWLDGLRVIRRERVLLVLLLALSITMLGEGVIGVLYPVFVYRVLHGGPREIGALMTSQAIGALIGGVLVGWSGGRILSRWAVGLCAFAFGCIDLVIFNLPALYPAFWIQVVLFIVVGMPGIGYLTGVQSLFQATSPDTYRGRVFGALGTSMSLLSLLGALIAGAVTDRFGVVAVLTFQGAGYIVAGLLMIALLPRGLAALGRRRATATPVPPAPDLEPAVP